MTTPYGKTSFTTWVDPSGANARWVEKTDSNGHTMHVEFRHAAPGIASSDVLAPVGLYYYNDWLNYRNTYIWDGATYAHAKGDYTQAMLYHWAHEQDSDITSGLLESIITSDLIGI
jgi:hypothetical protein